MYIYTVSNKTSKNVLWPLKIVQNVHLTLSIIQKIDFILNFPSNGIGIPTYSVYSTIFVLHTSTRVAIILL